MTPAVLMRRERRKPLTRFQRSLTQGDVDTLCAAGVVAWRQAPGSARRVLLMWRHTWFVAHHSTFRLKIEEVNGAPVACCWH
jgi:hypothetical protein